MQSDNSPFAKQLRFYSKLLRGQVDREATLAAHRTSALLVGEAILFAAHAVAVSSDRASDELDALRWVVPTVGITAAVLFLGALVTSVALTRRIGRRHREVVRHYEVEAARARAAEALVDDSKAARKARKQGVFQEHTGPEFVGVAAIDGPDVLADPRLTMPPAATFFSLLPALLPLAFVAAWIVLLAS